MQQCTDVINLFTWITMHMSPIKFSSTQLSHGPDTIFFCIGAQSKHHELQFWWPMQIE
jgi:hypothetical protein